jgi:predicted nuclease of predicted toxin-antitoxin system
MFRDHGLVSASDEQILQHAQVHGQVIVSADTDFTRMLALRGVSSPSLVLLRSADRLSPAEQATLLLANLAEVAEELKSGAVVTIARGHLRVRALPMARREGPR